MSLKAGRGAPLKPAVPDARRSGTGLIHKFVWTGSGDRGGRSPAAVKPSLAGGGGGGWSDTRECIRGNLAERERRRGGDHVGQDDVPVAAAAVANQVPSGRVRGGSALPRMPRVSGIAAPPPRGASQQKVRCALSSTRIRAAFNQEGRCRFESRRALNTLRRAHLGADRAARGDRARDASAARPRSRAWDVAARCGKLRLAESGQSLPRDHPSLTRLEAPHRATTSQSRPARIPRADRRPIGRSRDLRRAAQSVLREGTAAS